MHTIPLARTATDSIAIAAPPSDVHAFLARPDNLPRWAPAFAESVRVTDDRVFVTAGGTELPIDMRVSADQGTVDMVGVESPNVGAFLRVIPNGEGSECLFTIAFPAGTPDAAVVDQMAVVSSELEAIRSLVQAGGS